MKTNVRFLDTTWNTDNPNEVVCNITARIIIKKLPIDIFTFHKIIKKRFKDVSQNGTFKVSGKAVCHVNDKFNMECGKIIAKSKAEYKAYHKAKRIYNDICNWLDNQISDLGKLYSNCDNLCVKVIARSVDTDIKYNK